MNVMTDYDGIIAGIKKDAAEAKAIWIKAHEMFQQEIDDVKKSQKVTVDSEMVVPKIIHGIVEHPVMVRINSRYSEPVTIKHSPSEIFERRDNE